MDLEGPSYSARMPPEWETEEEISPLLGRFSASVFAGGGERSKESAKLTSFLWLSSLACPTQPCTAQAPSLPRLVPAGLLPSSAQDHPVCSFHSHREEQPPSGACPSPAEPGGISPRFAGLGDHISLPSHTLSLTFLQHFPPMAPWLSTCRGEWTQELPCPGSDVDPPCTVSCVTPGQTVNAERQ